MAVNNYGDLFFTNSTLYRAAADQTSNITLESDYFDDVNYIFYQ